jgi:hypothetical protein
MATVWEQIQEKRSAVEELQSIYQTKKAEFEADGIVDDDEKAKLARISGGLSTAQAKVKALEDEFKANKAKWEGRAADLKTFQAQINELFDWGDPQADEVAKLDGEIGATSRAMAWLDAIKKLDNAQVYIKPPYDEYQKQLPFRDKYIENHEKVALSAATHAKSDFARKDSIAKSLTAFDTEMKSAEDAAGDRRFDDACRFLDSAKSTSDDVGKEITELRLKSDEIRAKVALQNGEAALYATSKYKTVQELNEKMALVTKSIGELMTAFEFDKVLSSLAINEKNLAQMKAEHEAKEKEEAEWKKQQPKIDEAKKKAEEVKEFSGKDAAPDVGAKVDAAGQKATDEQFKDAAKTAEEAKAEADEAHAKMLEQKKKKEEAAQKLSDIDKRLEALLQSL